jgi:hypothetical protein
MEEAGLHPGLDIRLTALAARIATLRQKIQQNGNREQIAKFGSIDELDTRYKQMEVELDRLNLEGPGFLQDVKAGIDAMAIDLKGWVEDHIIWIDSGYQTDRRPRHR